jgi:hypothetical protein
MSAWWGGRPVFVSDRRTGPPVAAFRGVAVAGSRGVAVRAAGSPTVPGACGDRSPKAARRGAEGLGAGGGRGSGACAARTQATREPGSCRRGRREPAGRYRRPAGRVTAWKSAGCAPTGALVRHRTECDGGPLARSHLSRPVCIHSPNHLLSRVLPPYARPRAGLKGFCARGGQTGRDRAPPASGRGASCGASAIPGGFPAGFPGGQLLRRPEEGHHQGRT